jgi:CcmD family protein
MTYLFWSFAVVWIALFAYVRALTRRTRALEEEVHRLAGGLADPSTSHDLEHRPATAGEDLRPVRRDAPPAAGRAVRP